MAHHHGKCRRRVILEYFEECKDEVEIDGQCCDVCSQSVIREAETCECKEEVAAILKVVKDFPNMGVKKVSNARECKIGCLEYLGEIPHIHYS